MSLQIRPIGPAPSRVMIVGEFPSDQDLRESCMFTGASGAELSKMLAEAGLTRSACFVTSVLRSKPSGGELGAVIAERKKDITPQHGLLRDKYCLPPVFEGVETLRREIEQVQPNVIIAFGNLALWALTGNWGITKWRGSTLQTDFTTTAGHRPKVVPVYPPGLIMRQWSWRPIAVHDLRRAEAASKSPEYHSLCYQFVTRPVFDVALSILLQLQAQADRAPLKLSVDIETRAGHIACTGLAWSKTDALCIPWMAADTPDGHYWPADHEFELQWALYQLLTHPNCQVIGQNFLYDAQYFHRHVHYIPNLVRDTMLAQHVCFSNMQKGLDFLASMYAENYVYWKDEGKEWDDKTGEDQLWEYNCKDAVITFEVDTVLQSNIDQMRLRDVHDFQQRLFHPVLKTMNKGIRADVPRRSKFAMELLDEIAARQQWITDVVGYDLNIRSAPQMQDLFYHQLGQRPVLNRKTHEVSCDDEALGKIAAREPLLGPLCAKIRELRSLGVFLSTFVNAPLDIDQRIRCSFNIAGTETYRFSSSKNAFGTGLNLQNIPKGGEVSDDGMGDEDSDLALELPNIRSLFIPDPGMTFFDIDLASADLRIVVWEADEPELKRMLLEGLDPYTEIAKEFYHDPTITKKDPRRQTFKSFAHGTNYLGTAQGLAERLGLLVKQAEATQRWYFQRFPKIKQWQDDLKDQVLKRRMVQNVFGYRQYFFDRIEGTVFNQAAAWIPQSTVACLINRAYVAIDEQLPQVDILLQVHDSLAGQFPSHLGDWMTNQIVKLAEIPLPYSDPLTIPVGVKTSAKSWGDCD